MAQVINIREYPLSTSLYLYYQYTRPNGVIVVNTPTGSYDLDTVNATLTQTYQGSSNTTQKLYYNGDLYYFRLSDLTSSSQSPVVSVTITKNDEDVSNTVSFTGYRSSYTGWTAQSYSIINSVCSVYNNHLFFAPFISFIGKSTRYSNVQTTQQVLFDYDIETNTVSVSAMSGVYSLNGFSVESKISWGSSSTTHISPSSTTKNVSIINKSTPYGAYTTNLSDYGVQTRTITDIMTKPNTSFYRDGILYVIIDTHLFTVDVNNNLVEDTGTIINIPNFQSVIKVNDNQFLILGETSYIVEWVEYDFTYTINSNDGKESYLTLEGQSPITKVRFNYTGGNNVGYVFNTLSGEVSGRFEIEIPEGKSLLGFSSTPNSTRAPYPINTDVEVGIYENYSFYAVFLTYRPPATTFNIELYQNSAEVNRVDKGQFLVPVGSLLGALREECSMITPSIVYQSEIVPTFNYVYIPIFNRYYFVTSLSSVNKNMWRMELNCDVLMSYKNEILLLQGIIGRQEIDFNPLLVDNELPTQNNPIVEVIDIPSDAFNTQSDAGHNFLMTVIGA